MKLTNQSYTRTIAAATSMVVMLILVACAGPGDQTPKSDVAVSTPAPATAATPEPTPATDQQAEPSETDGKGAGDMSPAPSEPAPTKPGNSPIADRIPADSGSLNASCKVDADCEIKDVGSCCGFYPRCLNKDSQTFPEKVKAQCGKEGRVSACGFPAITSCECVQGKCSGVTISDDSQLVQ